MRHRASLQSKRAHLYARGTGKFPAPEVHRQVTLEGLRRLLGGLGRVRARPEEDLWHVWARLRRCDEGGRSGGWASAGGVQRARHVESDASESRVEKRKWAMLDTIFEQMLFAALVVGGPRRCAGHRCNRRLCRLRCILSTDECRCTLPGIACMECMQTAPFSSSWYAVIRNDGCLNESALETCIYPHQSRKRHQEWKVKDAEIVRSVRLHHLLVLALGRLFGSSRSPSYKH